MATRAIKPFPVELAPPPFLDTASIPPAALSEWRTLIADARAVTTFETGPFAVHRACRQLYYCGDHAFRRLWKAYGANQTAAAANLRSRPQTFGRLAHKYGPEGAIPPHLMGQHYTGILLPLLQRALAHETAKPRIEVRMACLLGQHPALAEYPPRHADWGDVLKEGMWSALGTHPRRDLLMAGKRPRIAYTQDYIDSWRARFKDDPLMLRLLPKRARPLKPAR